MEVSTTDRAVTSALQLGGLFVVYALAAVQQLRQRRVVPQRQRLSELGEDGLAIAAGAGAQHEHVRGSLSQRAGIRNRLEHAAVDHALAAEQRRLAAEARQRCAGAYRQQ